VFHAMRHLWRRAFAPLAALQILAMPLGIAAVVRLASGPNPLAHKHRLA
jgi:hypothetical protein